MRHDEEHRLTLRSVKERGWTASLIERFLGDPDAEAPNPRYPKAAPMKLYNLSRVEQAERSPEWLAATTALANRRAGAAKAVETKRAKLMECIEAMAVTVTVVSGKDLLKRAINSYNDRQFAFDRDGYADESSDSEFLERIQVNHIRHHLTSYDLALEEAAGQVGVMEAVRLIRKKIYTAIADAYPQFSEECGRQLQYRGIHSTGF